EEAVCDRAEAKWLAVRSGELPARQAEALRLKSEDLDVSQVAVRMGLSYRTVESLLARARRTLRASLAGTLGLVLLLLGRGRPRAGGNAHTVAVTSMAAALVVAGFVLPYALDAGGNGNGPTPRPAVSGYAQALRSEATGRGSAPGTPTPSHPTPGARGRAPSPTLGTSLPGVSASPLPELSAPPFPHVPEMSKVAGLPTALAGLPTRSAASSVRSLPSASTVPAAPLSVPRTPSRTPFAQTAVAPYTRPQKILRPARRTPVPSP
ncbi:sigma factor-like helix-turn-helix DNA-binding protein, partial [Streptomyces sp. NPDC003480]